MRERRVLEEVGRVEHGAVQRSTRSSAAVKERGERTGAHIRHKQHVCVIFFPTTLFTFLFSLLPRDSQLSISSRSLQTRKGKREEGVGSRFSQASF